MSDNNNDNDNNNNGDNEIYLVWHVWSVSLWSNHITVRLNGKAGLIMLDNNKKINESGDSHGDGVDDCVSGSIVTCNMTFETDLFTVKMRSHLSLNTQKLRARDERNGLGSRLRYWFNQIENSVADVGLTIVRLRR